MEGLACFRAAFLQSRVRQPSIPNLEYPKHPLHCSYHLIRHVGPGEPTAATSGTDCNAASGADRLLPALALRLVQTEQLTLMMPCRPL